jgi:hypothetical protein
MENPSCLYEIEVQEKLHLLSCEFTGGQSLWQLASLLRLMSGVLVVELIGPQVFEVISNVVALDLMKPSPLLRVCHRSRVSPSG